MVKRGERNTDVVSVGEDYSFLAEVQETDNSMDAFDGYQIVPRIKMVQGTSAAELKSKFEEGTAIISPGDAILSMKDESFLFCPIFFFAEYILWSDMDDTDTDAILQRTFDPTSEVAIRANSEETRMRRYGPVDKQTGLPKYTENAVEHLNFSGLIYGDHELSGTSATLSFSRGEWITGKNWIGAMQMRRANKKKIPLYCQVWAFDTNFRDKGPKKKWYGLDPRIPQTPVIAPDEVAPHKALHLKFQEAYEKDRLRVDHSDAEEREVDVEEVTSTM